MEQQRKYGQEFKLGAAQLIKRLGLLDDFKTFWIEKPYPGFFEYGAAYYKTFINVLPINGVSG